MSATKVAVDLALLEEAVESFERVGCQGRFCDGPTLEPVDMVTCHRCEALAKLRRKTSGTFLTVNRVEPDTHRLHTTWITGGPDIVVLDTEVDVITRAGVA